MSNSGSWPIISGIVGAYLYLVTGPILLLLGIISKGLEEATNFEESIGWIGESDSNKTSWWFQPIWKIC